jgi:RNA polymerase sigma-70 factor, ECF subfamily
MNSATSLKAKRESLGISSSPSMEERAAFRTSRPAPERAHTIRQVLRRKPESSAITETIRQAQLGDASAFENLYHVHSRRVYALCLRMLGDPVEAEDLTQEAFLQLFRKIHTFRGESALSSWLHRLTANLVLMRFRRKKPVTASLDEAVRTDGETDRPGLEVGVPDLALTGLFDRVNLQSALKQLPAGYRSMFILHDVYGYEHLEIAKILRCSVGNSKSQLHKARKRLRELLRGARHGVGGNSALAAAIAQ